VVRHLNAVFNRFDAITGWHGLEKIKTIGDEYMMAGGLPVPTADHAEAVVEAALDMLEAMREFDAEAPGLRIGVHSGPVVAGVIGTSKFAFDLWGDTVNVASRMQSQGVVGRIHLSAATWERLPPDRYRAAARGAVELKGHGPVNSFVLECRQGPW